MTPQYVLPLYAPQADLATVGGKGASLAQLSASGLPVPDGFHVTTAAYRKFIEANDLQYEVQSALEMADPAKPSTLETTSKSIRELFAPATIPVEVASEIVEAYTALPGKDPAVAVRSSATAEDLPAASFAGQQETYLNVSGASAVLEATKKCWSSLWTARAIAYRMRRDIDQHVVSLAVIVQLLVPAEASGILFTANPLNGKRSELMISAAWGLGEAVVGGNVTPDSLIIDKDTHRILAHQIAYKDVMTVRLNGGTQERPVPQNLRRAPVLDDKSAIELAKLGTQIEAMYAMPMDIEWTLADDKFAIVQARPITALPDLKPAPPIQWKLPKGKYSAMRNNIVELMADPLTPLFGTLGLEAINASMGHTFAEFLGKPGLMPEEVIITVNDYAYYNGSLSPGQIAKILLYSPGILKSMFTKPVDRWLKVGRPRYIATVKRWQNTHWRQFPSEAILDAARDLLEAAIEAYLSLVSGVLPAAWISEALFTFVYDKLIKRQNDPPAPVFLLGFDNLPIQAEKSLYDLAGWVRGRSGLESYIQNTSAAQLAAEVVKDPAPAKVSANDWREWRARFQSHLKKYGHTIYNLDFANPVPADDPAPLLETCKLFLSGQGVNPYERQRRAVWQRDEATKAILARLRGVRLKLFRKLVFRAQNYAPLREDGLADVGMSYPLLRQMLLEVGDRFKEPGMIKESTDIFWLKQEEIEGAVEKLARKGSANDMSAIVSERKTSWRAALRANPPLMLPQIKIFGIYLEDLITKRAGKLDEDILKGVAASPGRVTATARVLASTEDFPQLKPGDILVAAITTPAWTPLFARAVAIVTDVGGPLSHGSIVAREYGIPAVLGTGAATSRIQSGATVTVDGDEGKVYLNPLGLSFNDEKVSDSGK